MFRWLALAGAALAETAAADPPRLQVPVACEVGRTCFIQNYLDQDPSPESKDFACGTLTYDGHNGTDFRVPTLKSQVDVLAAADGRVLRARDDVPDVSVRAAGRREAVQGTECGNGLVVAHADGLETQYCHMAQGSLRVKPGDAVKAGQPIGRVGLSGLTEYPHLHLTVRQGGRVVDPFASGAPPGSCGGGASLWAVPLPYEPSAVLNVGFATGPVTSEAVESGEVGAAPGADAPALVAFARAIGLRAGDVGEIALKDPSGAVLAENKAEPLDRPKAQVLLFVGRRRPPSGWAKGAYQATYTVRRDGRIVLERSFATTF
jgi:murein DD-endopeptidase MepM/ murein hydrolase activator NlpD